MENVKLVSFLRSYDIEYRTNVEKQSLTGMKSNDILPIVAFPVTLQKFKELMLFVTKNNFSYEVVGALTNTYLADGFQRDILVKTTKLKGIHVGTDSIVVESGYSLTKLSREISSRSVTGYEGLIGIPGTVGGAVVNNSGGFNSSMDKVVKRILVLERGKEHWITSNNMDYSTRNSALKCKNNQTIVLAVELDTSKKRPQSEIDKELDVFSHFRKQWIDGTRKSLGSVFCANSLSELMNRHKVKFIMKRSISALLRTVVKNPHLNVWLEFFFLGNPAMAKHCDSLNRFCWDKDTTENDFFKYIQFLQDKAGGKMKLEIQIKR